MCIPVMGESAVMRLGGIAGMRNGPTTKVGIILMKSMLLFLAASHAAFSANVFETKYICISNERDSWYMYLICIQIKPSDIIIYLWYK